MITTTHTSMQAMAPVSAFAYTLSERDMRCIFEELRDMVDADSRGDIDGEQYEVDYKVFRIEAVHRYRVHVECGGDSCCGEWEMMPVVDTDSFEVKRVCDEEGTEYPELVARLNENAKKRVN